MDEIRRLPIQFGDPVAHRGVAVAPLFPRESPRAAYVTAEDAMPLGFRVTEVDERGSVPELLAANPLDTSVLLYDGEELVGAMQNRIVNVTVLVAPRTETRIPVSCVEEGRWSMGAPAFASARHHAHPQLRRRKAERLGADPLALGAAQGAVWDAVREKLARLEVDSPTLAASDVFDAREAALAGLRGAFPLQPGQSGAVLVLGCGRLCLDYVSRPDAFARLYPKLLDGYLLDAIEVLDGPAPPVEAVGDLLRSVATAACSRRPSAALGRDVRLHARGVVGSGLELDGELVQLCAFSTDGAGPATRIARPSRRR